MITVARVCSAPEIVTNLKYWPDTCRRLPDFHPIRPIIANDFDDNL